MILLILFAIVGLILLGGIFCIALVGGTPWSNGNERKMVAFGDRKLTVSQASLGLILIISGVFWLVTWFYLLIAYGADIYGQWDARAVHYFFQMPISLVLLFSGIAILRQWKRWRGAYLISVALLFLSLANSLSLVPTDDPIKAIFRYILPAITLAIVGGVALFVYIIIRVLRLESLNSQKTIHGNV